MLGEIADGGVGEKGGCCQRHTAAIGRTSDVGRRNFSVHMCAHTNRDPETFSVDRARDPERGNFFEPLECRDREYFS
jgi:hypothetical protein